MATFGPFSHLAAGFVRVRGMNTISFIADTKEDAAFRLEVRGWLEEHLPPELQGWSTRPPPELIRPWQRKLYDRGWIAPTGRSSTVAWTPPSTSS